MKIVHYKNNRAPASAAPSIPVSDTIQKLIERSKTPEAKIKAFEALFETGTDQSIKKAVDYFFENPALFSQTVQKLASEVTHKDQLKKFLQKMAASEDQIASYIQIQYMEACVGAKTISEYQQALRPVFVFEEAIAGIDRKRRAARSCPSECDLLSIFNKVNDGLNELYGPLLFKKLAKIYVSQGPA